MQHKSYKQENGKILASFHHQVEEAFCVWISVTPRPCASRQNLQDHQECPFHITGAGAGPSTPPETVSSQRWKFFFFTISPRLIWSILDKRCAGLTLNALLLAGQSIPEKRENHRPLEKETLGEDQINAIIEFTKVVW